MNFTYFKGPPSDMAALLPEKTTCSLCGNTASCFELDYAISEAIPANRRKGKLGCLDCLQTGKFEFWHDTEFGMLDENGLKKVYNHNIENPPAVSPEILTELRRTPQILTWQQELWLTHCNDFMIYLGNWEPADFYENSADGNGRALFMEMTSIYNHLWDESLEEGTDILMEWHATYYAFKCRHCGKLRGNWDCD